MGDDEVDDGGGLLDIEDEPEEREWKFTQWFRKSPNDANTEGMAEDQFDISSVQFDRPGDYLATGDNSGNIVVLKNDPEQARARNELVRFVFHCEFQSHFPEFDFVSSSPISERINDIKWGPRTNDSLFLLTTSCKHVKLWKITEREPFRYVNCNFAAPQDVHAFGDQGSPMQIPRMRMRNEVISELKVPQIVREDTCAITSLKKWYPYEGHLPNINHLAVTADQENFISGDFFKINLWDLFRQDACYTITDFFPTDGSPPREVITCMDTHPLNSHIFVHGSNLGKMRICDLRQRALADSAAKMFNSVRNPRLIPGKQLLNPMNQMDDEEQQSLFDEVTSGVAGAKFSRGGRYIFSRDYMSVKIWDVRYEKRPFEKLYTQEFLRERLFELYQNEYLADAFGLGVSSSGDVVTGSYSNYFHLFELKNKRDVFIQASREPQTISPISQHLRKRKVNYASAPSAANASAKKKKGFGARLFGSNRNNSKVKSQGRAAASMKEASEVKRRDDYPLKLEFDNLEFEKKIIDCAWHPQENAVAVTGQNSLFIYSK